MQPVDKMYLRVAKIQTFAGTQPLTNATGFFLLHDEFLYLVTARHVIIDETSGHHPDRLRLSLHSNAAELQQRTVLAVPLFVDGVPQWYQHPVLGMAADVVAVAINDPRVLARLSVVAFRVDDILDRDEQMPLGQNVLILGYPLGFSDTFNNLAIVRSATIASSFSHPFKGGSYFLTDARLHRGMSGSPVIVSSVDGSDSTAADDSKWRLIGVHTSALDVSDRDPIEDERLALNATWYATLIAEMLPVRAVQKLAVPG